MTPNNITSIADFFTADLADKGISVDLLTPDKQPSGAWIKVKGMDSDDFRRASVERTRKGQKILKLEGVDRLDAQRQADAELIAAVTLEWSFTEPCTKENVVQLYLQAPDVFEQVNSAIADRGLLFKKR